MKICYTLQCACNAEKKSLQLLSKVEATSALCNTTFFCLPGVDTFRVTSAKNKHLSSGPPQVQEIKTFFSISFNSLAVFLQNFLLAGNIQG